VRTRVANYFSRKLRCPARLGQIAPANLGGKAATTALRQCQQKMAARGLISSILLAFLSLRVRLCGAILMRSFRKHAN